MVSGINPPATQSSLVEVLANTALVNQSPQSGNITSRLLVIGKQFEAEVIASLKDGTNIVKVADIVARMQLPYVPEVGAKLQLMLVSTSPRMTFLLKNDAQQAGTAATQSIINDAHTNPRLNTPTNSLFSSTSTAFSSAAKLIGQLIQQLPEENTVTPGKGTVTHYT